MRFLLDTDTCVFWLRGQNSVRDHIAVAGSDAIGISVVTLAELRYGAAYSERPESNHQAIDDFVRPLSVIGIDSEIARTFGEIKAQLRKEGKLIEDLDLLLAASARTYQLTLVTNNQDHFSRVAELRLENWSVT